MKSLLAREEIEELKEHFEHYDTQHKGWIKTSDLLGVVRRVGLDMTKEELEGLVDSMDNKHTGYIYWDDFIENIAGKVNGNAFKEEVINALSIFDRDGTGRMSMAELPILLSNLLNDLKLNSVEIGQIISKGNQDQDGLVNIREFVDNLYS